MVLSPSEMLALWRRTTRLEPLGGGISAYSTGLDSDALLRTEIDAWYGNLLDTAPLSMLAPVDIRTRSTLSVDANGIATVTLPDQARRIVEVRLTCWERPATILDPDLPDHRAAIERLASPFLRGGCVEPVAVRHHSYLTLYSVPTGIRAFIDTLLAVVHEPDSYSFHPSALTTIPNQSRT